MNVINGGVITDIAVFPMGDRQYSLGGVWTGLDWRPGSNTNLSFMRKGSFAGSVRLLGVESSGGRPREFFLIVECPRGVSAPEPGDLVLFDRGAVSSFKLKTPIDTDNRYVAIELDTKKPFRGIIKGDQSRGMLFLFHDSYQEFSGQLECKGINVRSEYEIDAEFLEVLFGHFTLDFRFANKNVAAAELIGVLSPVRTFILDAGQEMQFGTPRSKGRRSRQIAEKFEPVITAKAGSVKLSLHPAESGRDLLSDGSEAIHLLAKVLEYAAAGNRAGVIDLLKNNVIRVDDSLRQLESIIQAALKRGNVEFSSSYTSGHRTLDGNALDLVSSIISPEPRVLAREGDLYAFDFKRKWCKVSTSNTDPVEDWKLSITDKLIDSVRGSLPRRVIVSFVTQSPDYKLNGSGTLLSIKDIGKDGLK